MALYGLDPKIAKFILSSGMPVKSFQQVKKNSLLLGFFEFLPTNALAVLK
jgi:hypothetical protein